MKKPRFLRSDTVRHPRLGKYKKRLQKWRRPRGRHSKIRRKRFSYPVQPGIGYKQPAEVAGLVNGTRPVYIGAPKDVEKVSKGSAIIISRRLSARTRVELLKRAHALGLVILNHGGSHEAR